MPEQINLNQLSENNKSGGGQKNLSRNNSFESKDIAPENYKEWAHVLYRILEGNKKAVESGHVFTYDQHTETTSRGTDILIDTLIWPRNEDWKVVPDGNQQRGALIAVNKKTKKIAGIRIIETHTESDPNKIFFGSKIVTGVIATRERNTGVATVIDASFVTMLQNMANENTHLGIEPSLIWQARNTNLVMLEKFRKEKPEALGLKENEDEQERWKSLYWGEDSKFKLEQSTEDPEIFTRIFKPDSKPTTEKKIVDMKKYEEILAVLRESIY